jgi:hypothetical protein
MTMRSTSTAVLEKHAVLDGPLSTEPYELPWADQARFFVHTLSQTGDGATTYYTEISPDGLHWCDSGEAFRRVEGPGLISWSITGFGQWLRLRCIPDQGTTPTVRIYLVGSG